MKFKSIATPKSPLAQCPGRASRSASLRNCFSMASTSMSRVASPCTGIGATIVNGASPAYPRHDPVASSNCGVGWRASTAIPVGGNIRSRVSHSDRAETSSQEEDVPKENAFPTLKISPPVRFLCDFPLLLRRWLQSSASAESPGATFGAYFPLSPAHFSLQSLSAGSILSPSNASGVLTSSLSQHPHHLPPAPHRSEKQLEE